MKLFLTFPNRRFNLPFQIFVLTGSLNMNENKKNTKIRILDVAEELFARHGFAGTSLRALTKAAEVNLAAVNYHFGSKEALIEEVIKRRLLPLNQLRMEKIEIERKTARREHRPPDVTAALRAFVEPTISFSRSGPGPNFTNLISRAFTESDETPRLIFMQNIQPLFHLLFSTLCEARPEIPAMTIFWRLHFFIGSIVHTMNIHNKKLHPPDDMGPELEGEALTDMLLSYATAGMLAPE